MPLNPTFENEKRVLDNGYVRLLDVMGDDSSPDSDARISTGHPNVYEPQQSKTKALNLDNIRQDIIQTVASCTSSIYDLKLQKAI